MIAAPPEPWQARVVSRAWHAFMAELYRDLYVTWKELPTFVAQVILQPLFLLFIFGKVLGVLGYTRPGYAHLLFPGLLALTAVVTGMQALAFPLISEFGWTMEIEDRLLAPLPIGLVAAEKVVFASLRSMVATSLMIPAGIIVLGSIPWYWGTAGLFVLVAVLGAVLGASLGLLLGTLVPPSRANMLYALMFTPLIFTGASQYPWPSLARLRWFQVITAINPMTYVSEGLRAAAIPNAPHIESWICVVVLVSSIAILLAIGVKGFYRRAIG